MDHAADAVRGHYEVVVVGAGPAGVSAALRAAELGASVAVLEAGRVGGTCVNTGCVPTRVLARAARLVRETRSAEDFGVRVDLPGGPRLAWERTTARVRAVVEDVQAAKGITEQLAAAGVDLVTEGAARFTGPHELECTGTGRRVTADAVVLATGGHSRRLPVPGIELTTAPEHVVDLAHLPASAVVVGSGNTGSQLVTVLSAFGVRVTLLELADRVLPTADHDVSAALGGAFAAAGVDVRTGITGVHRVEVLEGGLRRLVVGVPRPDGPDGAAGAEREEHVDAEVVVVCAGWPARLDGLGLEAAGVTATRSAVPVDAFQRTDVPHVLVAGDADGDAALVQAGVADGFVAATNAVSALRGGSGEDARTDHSVLPSGGFTDPDYGQVGLTEADARAADEGALVALVPYAEVERAVIDGRTAGFLKLIATADGSRLLGAHAVGEQALEVVQAVATAMAAGAGVQALAATEYAYPTYTSVIGLAAVRLLRASGRDELVPRAWASVSAADTAPSPGAPRPA